MTNEIFSLRARELARIRLPRSGRRLRTVRSIPVEQAARLAPDWGAVEAPGAGEAGMWNVRSF